MENDRIRTDLLLGVGVLCWIALLMVVVGPGLHPDPAVLPIEAVRYLRMAGWNPGVAMPEPNFPSQFRILSPALVRAMPLDPVIGFHLLTLAGLTTFSVLLRRIAVRLGLSARESLFGVALWATLFYPTVYYTRNPFMTDPLFLVFWATGILTIFHRRPVLLALIMLVGVLNKETIVFLTPAALVLWFERPRPVRSLLPAALVPLPALALYLGLGSFYGRGSTHAARTPGFLFDFFLGVVSDPHLAFEIVVGALLAGAPLWIYVITGWGDARPRLRRYLVAGAASVLPLLLLASDSGRQLAKFPPFWIPFVVSSWGQWLRPRAVTVAVALAGTSGLVLAAAVVLELPFSGELAVRVLGVFIALTPFALRLRPEWATAS